MQKPNKTVWTILALAALFVFIMILNPYYTSCISYDPPTHKFTNIKSFCEKSYSSTTNGDGTIQDTVTTTSCYCGTNIDKAVLFLNLACDIIRQLLGDESIEILIKISLVSNFDFNFILIQKSILKRSSEKSYF